LQSELYGRSVLLAGHPHLRMSGFTIEVAQMSLRLQLPSPRKRSNIR
jgi:hypothetical protein